MYPGRGIEAHELLPPPLLLLLLLLLSTRYYYLVREALPALGVEIGEIGEVG